MTTLFFAYSIVPTGQDEPRLVTGILYVSSLEEAKHHVQTLNAPAIAGKSDLEVVLHDMAGAVVWRGPYLGERQQCLKARAATEARRARAIRRVGPGRYPSAERRDSRPAAS